MVRVKDLFILFKNERKNLYLYVFKSDWHDLLFLDYSKTIIFPLTSGWLPFTFLSLFDPVEKEFLEAL